MGSPCAPMGGWRAGWWHGRRRSSPRSLSEQSGPVTIRGTRRVGPVALSPGGCGPPRGKEGGPRLAWRGGTGPMSPSRLPALGRLGGGGGGGG